MSEREEIERGLQFYKDRLKTLDADLHYNVLSAYQTQGNMDECKEKIKGYEIELDCLFPCEKEPNDKEPT